MPRRVAGDDAGAAAVLMFGHDRDAHPHLSKTIHQPVTDLVSECGLELTPTPITEALRNL